jgi:hypothetical protein
MLSTTALAVTACEMDRPWIAALCQALADGVPLGARLVAAHTWRASRSEWACVLHLTSETRQGPAWCQARGVFLF